MEITVDPLFKKMSADFDEGGAKGLLLNHLCLDVDGRIIFDASDAIMDSDLAPQINIEGADLIDLASLKGMRDSIFNYIVLLVTRSNSSQIFP